MRSLGLLGGMNCESTLPLQMFDTTLLDAEAAVDWAL
jgi:hypothetical protein